MSLVLRNLLESPTLLNNSILLGSLEPRAFDVPGDTGDLGADNGAGEFPGKNNVLYVFLKHLSELGRFQVSLVRKRLGLVSSPEPEAWSGWSSP